MFFLCALLVVAAYDCKAVGVLCHSLDVRGAQLGLFLIVLKQTQKKFRGKKKF
jgi:hypothetical protein